MKAKFEAFQKLGHCRISQISLKDGRSQFCFSEKKFDCKNTFDPNCRRMKNFNEVRFNSQKFPFFGTPFQSKRQDSRGAFKNIVRFNKI